MYMYLFRYAHMRMCVDVHASVDVAAAAAIIYALLVAYWACAAIVLVDPEPRCAGRSCHEHARVAHALVAVEGRPGATTRPAGSSPPVRGGPLSACCACSLCTRTCFRAARRRALRRRRLDGRRVSETDRGAACIAAVTIVSLPAHASSEVHASTCVV